MGSIGVFKDERELLRLEEEKMRAVSLAALGRLAKTAGHDIKQDIGAVLNYIDSLEHSADDPFMRTACLAIRDAATDAHEKLQNMLMTAKTEPPRYHVVSLTSLLKDFEAGMQARMLATRAEVSLQFPTSDALILGDRDQIRQVLNNLLGNSIDAIKSARLTKDRQLVGKLAVVLEVGENRLILSWSDKGCGMSELESAKAFTACVTTKETGSGLGLFITKTIIENHGGRITVGPAEGGGTCFRITIPLLCAHIVPQDVRARPHEVSRKYDFNTCYYPMPHLFGSHERSLSATPRIEITTARNTDGNAVRR